ncbi:hypothetical protein [Thermobrachium celere]|uniref:hypothetical protein n=1 Tax=Thermobrachium celere TaxID=53422 RepID=UPI00194114C9|nr:hypothetical protein [Thermobrachium celere]GFR36055.1 hypothetical protein TCEA9_18670 [Thermobrachium celere]
MLNISSDLDYLLDVMGKQIKINSTTSKAIISNFDTYNSKYKIITKTEIKTGDLIEWNDEKYLIISEISKKEFYFKAIMQKINHKIKLNFNGQIKVFDSIIIDKVYSTEQENYLQLLDNQILVILQDNADTKQIQLGQRIIKFNQAWKVKNIKLIQNGIVELLVETDLVQTDDDLINEIANYKPQQPPVTNYSVTFEGSDTIKVNYTQTYTAKLLNNGVEVTGATFTFAIDDTTNAQITSTTANTVTVKCLNASNTYVTITAMWSNDSSVKATKQAKLIKLF